MRGSGCEALGYQGPGYIQGRKQSRPRLEASTSASADKLRTFMEGLSFQVVLEKGNIMHVSPSCGVGSTRCVV
jgi:hypothetical protein